MTVPGFTIFPNLLRVNPMLAQFLVKLLFGAWVQQFAGRCNGIFAHFVACEHVTQRIRYEEHPAGVLQGGVAAALHGIELEDGIKVHKLYASFAVNIFLVYFVFEIIFHHAKVCGSRYANGLRRMAPSSPMHTKSTPHVSMLMELMAIPRCATIFSPLMISSTGHRYPNRNGRQSR